MLTGYSELLKKQNFLYLWSSQILSQVTINILNFLFLFRLYERTQSTIATSFLWLAYSLPAILVGPFASALSDVVDRKKLLMSSLLLQSLTIILFSLVDRISPFLIYVVAVTYSLFNQFYFPAELSTLPSIIKRELFTSANTLFFLTQQGALILGLGFSVPLKNSFGFEATLLICAALIFMAFVSVSLLPSMKASVTIRGSFEKALAKFFERIVEGARLIASDKKIFSPFFLILAIQVTLAMIVVNLPLITIQVFQIPLDFAGIYLAVPAGIGAALSGVVISTLIGKYARKISIIENSLTAILLAFAAIIYVVPNLDGTIKSVSAIALIFLMGFSFVGVIIPTQTFLQEMTPPKYRGRVFGNLWFLITLATVFPVVASGTISELFGVKLLLSFILVSFLVILILLKRGYRSFSLRN